MNFENPEEETFLSELYTMTEGDIEKQVSMYDVGTNLGLDNNEAEGIAQSLYIQEFAEMKTLSGGMGITAKGLKALNVAVSVTRNGITLSLGNEPVLGDEAREVVKSVLKEIKAHLAGSKATDYETLEEMVMDIKTIEVQMLSPKPKTQIIREILKSLNNGVSLSGSKEISDKLDALISS